MTIRWKQIRFWSVAFSIPIIMFIVAKQFMPDGHKFVDCPRCRKYIAAGAALRLQVHLTDDHDMPLNEAVAAVGWIYKKFLERKRS